VKRSIARLLTAPVVVLALLPAVACSFGQSGSRAGRPIAPRPSAVEADSTSPPVGIVGNCNAVGDNNHINCTFPSTSKALIEVAPSIVKDVWFDGPPDQLPTPPDYRSENYPCGDWLDWLRGTPNIYFNGPEIDIGLHGDVSDAVALTQARITILKRTKRQVTNGTWINCYFGGGTNAPFYIEVDTGAKTTTLAKYNEDHTLGPAQPMPPAAISLGDGEDALGTVGVRSLPGYCYEGYLTFSATVNGKPWEKTIGSAERPLRWISASRSDYPEGATTSFYGWDRAKKQWVKDFNPFGR
jgi:hypothetical protein